MPFWSGQITCDTCGNVIVVKSDAKRFLYHGRRFVVCADSTKTNARWEADGDPQYCLKLQKQLIDDLAQRRPEYFKRG